MSRVDSHGWSCWDIFCVHPKLLRTSGTSLNRLHRSACLTAPTSNLSQLLTLPILLKLTFSAKFLRGLITFAQVVLAIFSTLLFSIPLSKCLLKSVYFSVGFFFVVLKTSLCTLDSSSFTCLSSLSILYQTVPYAFI